MDHLQIDLDKLQQIQDSFCEAASVFAFCVDENGKKLTQMSGIKDEARKIMGCVNAEALADMLGRVMSSRVEDQIIEESSEPGVSVACLSIKVNHVPIINWIIYAALKQTGQYSCTTTRERFVRSLELLRVGARTLLNDRYEAMNAQIEYAKSKKDEQELEVALRKSQAISEIVRYMESDEGIEAVIDGVLQVAGRCVKLSNAFVIRNNADDSADIIGQYTAPDSQVMFSPRIGIEMPDFAKDVERVVALSSDTRISNSMRENLYRYGIEALVMVPLKIRDKNAMTVCFTECRRIRRWNHEEIKFLGEITQMLQNIMMKRIQQNSLAGSYVSLERILDNVGSSILVRDIESGKALFINKILKNQFGIEEDSQADKHPFIVGLTVDESKVHREVFDESEGRWYDLHSTNIKWVDGRVVSLLALYDITDKKTYQDRIEQQANNDFLTGLYNRMCCERDLKKSIERCIAENTNGVLLYLDLDDFKHINDGLGHQYGDVLLQAISHSFQRIEGIEDTCYRMGGDEFVIIIQPEYYQESERIFREIKNIFDKPWFLKGADYYCTMSMGVVIFPNEGDNVQDLIRKADIAMYEAKRSGKNKLAHFSQQSDNKAFQRLGMEKNMRKATSTSEGFEEFEVYYQPIIDVTKPGCPCVGAEALLRWNNSELGFISPADFIPLAEYLGLINPIGNYVLKKACIECRKWNDLGHPEYKVNVNLSVVQLLQEDIVESISAVIDETAINPANLTLEVTESLAINDMSRMKEVIKRIRALGARIALDDFGTGYSSLNHIREIALDVIKVDQSFVRDLSINEYSQSFIRMVSELARTLDVNVCVEGIETKEQYEVIKDMKISMIQGYYFGKPMPAKAFEDKYIFKEA